MSANPTPFTQPKPIFCATVLARNLDFAAPLPSGKASQPDLSFISTIIPPGKAGRVYIEDLFVRLSHRKRGIGRALFSYLAKLALKEDLGRIVWQVLDWNQSAIEFYKAMGATHCVEWQTMRLSRPAIEPLDY